MNINDCINVDRWMNDKYMMSVIYVINTSSWRQTQRVRNISFLLLKVILFCTTFATKVMTTRIERYTNVSTEYHAVVGLMSDVSSNGAFSFCIALQVAVLQTATDSNITSSSLTPSCLWPIISTRVHVILGIFTLISEWRSLRCWPIK